MNVTRPVLTEFQAVEFGILSADEVRSYSVKQITNPITFSNTLLPLPGGLHDPALGSFQDGPCKTCYRRSREGCPGHCGHIELPIAVYHPTFLDYTLRLIRGKCAFCHYFRLPRVVVSSYIAKLQLLNYGLIKEAAEMDRLVSSDGKKDTAESEEDEEDEGLIGLQQRYVRQMLKLNRSTKLDKSAASTEAVGTARRELLRVLLADIVKPGKCHNCQGYSPSYRKERYLKIFRKAIPYKQHLSNRDRNLKLRNPLVILQKRESARQAKQEKAKRDQDADSGVSDMDTASEDNEGPGEDLQQTMDVDFDDSDGVEESLPIDPAVDAHGLSKGPAPSTSYFVTSKEVHAALTLLFEHESNLLQLMFSPRSTGRASGKATADMFFIQTILVPPTTYRPENPGAGGSMTENSANSLYRAVLHICQSIQQIMSEIRGDPLEEGSTARRDVNSLKLAQVDLQDAVNSLVDKTSGTKSQSQTQAEGIKQLLEKKEGLFRKNMMGKRVNFAGRSVISPDPNLETNEIGVPPVFAIKLTYPEPVTQHNYYDLRQAVLNGPDTWPGAVSIEMEDGRVHSLQRKSADERLAMANQLLAPSKDCFNGRYGKKVHRHLNSGDIVIMNRQPTLHKPSMMCHRTRVLPGEKTIRMHYANCNTYNADFDGDEMNMHFPQNELARAEANLVADTDHQYLSGTAGKPLRGLIQDHISMGVHLTSRDIFFDREEYQQLVYAAMRPEHNHTIDHNIKTVPPAIMKPKPLWTGKQLITTILLNIKPVNHGPLTLTSKAQTDGERWKTRKDDHRDNEQIVIFKDGELLCGVLDKKQIGPASGGFVHCVYEAYGHVVAGRLLSILGRLLTKILHMRAFSCGVEDLVFTEDGEKIRRELLSRAEKVGLEVATKYVTLDNQNADSSNPELLRRLESVLRDDDQQKGLDEVVKAQCSSVSSEVTKRCLPSALDKPFPKNQMQLMTGSGAKGSIVNANLISCNLGQQVLEGRRVPTMVSGKTLPCFKPFETHIRAGGYIVQRFLTGIRPQEYYFHAMAGREGLIDTAVKTSRSGYLQRCLIKGMEGLKVEYDNSVRDADGTVVQFLYGEDGLDVCKRAFLTNFKFMAENFQSIYAEMNVGEKYPQIKSDEASAYTKKAAKGFAKRGIHEPSETPLSKFSPSSYAGSTSEKYYLAMKKYLDDNPDRLITNRKAKIEGIIPKRNLEPLLEVKYMNTLVDPGEAVGVVAGQSIGEPSTQMTLNTFHLAGHSSKNVTLGIPRLREIVMTASAKISTPMMTLHTIKEEVTAADAEKFAKAISRLSLSEVIDKIVVTERVDRGKAHSQSRFYEMRLDFYPAEEYCVEYNIQVYDVVNTVAARFLPAVQRAIQKELKRKGITKASDAAPEIGLSIGATQMESGKPASGRKGDEEDSDEEEEHDDDDDAAAAKRRANRSENEDWDAPDEDEADIASQASEMSDDEDDEKGEDALTPRLQKQDDTDDEDGMDVEAAHAPKIYIEESQKALEDRVKMMSGNSYLSSFEFDPSGQWCKADLEYPASLPKILILQIVENAARSAVVQAVEGLKACMFDKDNKEENPMTGEKEDAPAIITEGVNLIAMREFQDVINPHKMFTNDIAAMLRIYGVEACRATILREMSAVFESHAIDVDNRHLNLIADCMTRGGGFTAFNRVGMRNAASPLMKMSFETTVGFLKDACLNQDADSLMNPSARIVMGKLNSVGTGSFDVLAPAVEYKPRVAQESLRIE